MICTILGSGGSEGVPQLNCKCYICSSQKAFNQRSRTSMSLRSSSGSTMLIDTSPDLRWQMLREQSWSVNYGDGATNCRKDELNSHEIQNNGEFIYNNICPKFKYYERAFDFTRDKSDIKRHAISFIEHNLNIKSTNPSDCDLNAGRILSELPRRSAPSRYDAVLYTHAHYDHVAGINDIKSLRNLIADQLEIPAFMDENTYSRLNTMFDFVFKQKSQYYRALLAPWIFYGPFSFSDFTIQPFKQRHGASQSTGFRINNIAYCTDVDLLDENAIHFLMNLEALVITCNRYSKSYTHFGIEDVVEVINLIHPKIVILTHLSHEVCWYEIAKIALILNDDDFIVIPGFDGMQFVI